MTVNEAIMQVDALKPNMFPASRKVEWLNRLDGMLFSDVIMQHEREAGTPDTFVPYDPDGDLDDPLIAPFPYDSVYRFWLESQIDLANSELVKYNQSSVLFNQALAEFAGYYNRIHRPIQKVPGIIL